MKSIRYAFYLSLMGIFFCGGPNLFFKTSFVSNTPIIVQATCPTIDAENIMITKPLCNQSNGSITGLAITSSGTKVTYIWRDQNNTKVGTQLDLTGIPAGTYTLEVNDNSGCNHAVFSFAIMVINANAVSINASKVIVTQSGCNSDGSITGVNVSGATSYQWRNFLMGTTITTPTPDLVGVPPGTYALTASNAKGCSAQSAAYTVLSKTPVPGIANVKIINPTCASTLDSIEVTLSVQKGSAQEKFFFADSQMSHLKEGFIFGDTAFPTVQIGGLASGTYGLYVYTDAAAACPVLLGLYTLKPAVINIDSANIFNDKCNMHNGAIEPYISGLGKRPTYSWRNVATTEIVGHFHDLTGVGAGTYSLFVLDPEGMDGCEAFGTFIVTNESPALAAPIIDNVTLCLPGQAEISVQNVMKDTAGTYRLYANLSDSIPIASNTKGVFFRQVKKSTDFYVAYKQSDCESTRTKVAITVVADLVIPNAFTPNNDGINDVWNITGINKFPGATIDIFNRNGQLVFHSVNYTKQFDGTYNAKPLPAGVYYYIIDVKLKICFGQIAGNLTVLR